MSIPPTPFEIYAAGTLLHGTRAQLEVGDMLTPGRRSNFEPGRVMNHVYVTETLDAATWGAELAAGGGPCRIYVVQPIGGIEDDPNVTDKKLPGNPTRSFRTKNPVRIVGEVTGWAGHSEEQLRSMHETIAELRRQGFAIIHD